MPTCGPRACASASIFCTCAGLGLIGAIADGVGEVRRAVREQVRNGANQIKIMAGGGVSSPTDPLEGTQFSIDELRAACEEAEAANLYAMAHAYSPRAVTRAVQAGVRSIEHGNLIDEATARSHESAWRLPGADAVHLCRAGRRGQRLGWSPSMLDKLRAVHERGIEALRIARAEGVPIVFGTDLLGHMHARQSGEFELRLAAMSPVEVLQSATIDGRASDAPGRPDRRTGCRRLGRSAGGRRRPDARSVDAGRAPARIAPDHAGRTHLRDNL